MLSRNQITAALVTIILAGLLTLVVTSSVILSMSCGLTVSAVGFVLLANNLMGEK